MKLCPERLYTSTQLVKLFDAFFLVDCWHHRIIYSYALESELKDWWVLDDELAGPHSIASSGKFYITEDTGRHGLKIYKKDSEFKFTLVDYLSKVGIRPHRVIFDEERDLFWVVGSMSQDIFVLRRTFLGNWSTRRFSLSEMHLEYCRSITLNDGQIFVVGSSKIAVYNITSRGLKFSYFAPYPNFSHTGNDLFFSGTSAGILTMTQGKALMFDNLDQISVGSAKDISDVFTGTPYSVSKINGFLCIPEITEYTRIRLFSFTNDQVKPIKTLFDFGLPIESDLLRKAELPV